MSPQESPLDIRERGKTRDGQPDALDRRLFMQLLAFGESSSSDILIEWLEEEGFDGVLYEDINDPQGVALLTFHEQPDFFVTTLRKFLSRVPFGSLLPKPEYTMLGRTYAIGYERDLEETLLRKPRAKVSNPAWPWAIWYPLKRQGSFEQLARDEQMELLREHGGIGRAYGEAGHGYDIRLACYGLDKHDNDFVVGLIGPELFPLSSIVQAMRKTQQTAKHMQRMGPFFVGKAIWQRNRSEA